MVFMILLVKWNFLLFISFKGVLNFISICLNKNFFVVLVLFFFMAFVFIYLVV